MPEDDDLQEPENSGEEEIPEDISPEDLAREVTDGLEEDEEPTDNAAPEEEPSADSPADDSESANQPEEELTAEEESTEDTGQPPSQSEDEETETDEDVSPEDLAREAADSGEKTAEQPGEETDTEEEPEPAPEPEEETDAEEEPEPEARPEEETDAEEEPEPDPEPEEEPDTEEEPASAAGPEEEEGSIKDILEEEATRAREEPEEEEEEEEELPGGYLTGDQLPEEEEFTIPPWIITTAKYLGILLLILAIIYYLLMPGLEAFLFARMNEAFEQDSPRLGRLYARAGMFLDGRLIRNPDEFRAAYLKFLLESEQFDLFREEYEDLAPPSPPPRTLQVYTQYLLQQARWEEAREQALELQQYHQTRGIGFLFAGRALLNLGDYSAAQTAAARAREDRPSDPERFRLERDIAFALGQIERSRSAALQLFRLAAEEEEFEINAHDYVQLGKIQAQLGNISAAIEMFTNAISYEPHQPEALSFLVRYFTIERRWGRAEDYLLGAPGRPGYRMVYPYDALGWWAEAELEFNRDNTERAVLLVERALAIEPRNPEANRVLGLIHLDGFESPRMALRYLERARELDLDRFEFMNQLARAYFEAELYLEAVDVYYELDERLEDEIAALWYNIGTCYLGAHELDMAEEYLDRAYRLGYREAEIYNQRGLLYELRDELQMAYEMYWEGIEILEDADEDVTLIRSNLNRAFAAEEPVPLSDWIGSVEKNLR